MRQKAKGKCVRGREKGKGGKGKGKGKGKMKKEKGGKRWERRRKMGKEIWANGNGKW